MIPLFIYIKTNRMKCLVVTGGAGSFGPHHICAGAESVIVLHRLEILHSQGVTSLTRLRGDQGTRVLDRGADITGNDEGRLTL